MEKIIQEKKSNSFLDMIKGVGVAFVFTVICLLIFATLLTYTSLEEKYIQTVIIVITSISILLGSSISNFKIKKNGLLNGSVIGSIYMLCIYVLSSIVNTNFEVNGNSIAMILIGIVFGAIGGIIGVNKR